MPTHTHLLLLLAGQLHVLPVFLQLRGRNLLLLLVGRQQLLPQTDQLTDHQRQLLLLLLQGLCCTWDTG